jgi:hypothetical protein
MVFSFRFSLALLCLDYDRSPSSTSPRLFHFLSSHFSFRKSSFQYRTFGFSAMLSLSAGWPASPRVVNPTRIFNGYNPNPDFFLSQFLRNSFESKPQTSSNIDHPRRLLISSCRLENTDVLMRCP